MPEGWKCPHCGKAHGPHVDTCPVDDGPGLSEEEFQEALQWQAALNATIKGPGFLAPDAVTAPWPAFPDLPPALDRRPRH